MARRLGCHVLKSAFGRASGGFFIAVWSRILLARRRCHPSHSERKQQNHNGRAESGSVEPAGHGPLEILIGGQPHDSTARSEQENRYGTERPYTDLSQEQVE